MYTIGTKVFQKTLNKIYNSCIINIAFGIGQIRTVVSISDCGSDDLGSIPRFDNFAFCPEQRSIFHLN